MEVEYAWGFKFALSRTESTRGSTAAYHCNDESVIAVRRREGKRMSSLLNAHCCSRWRSEARHAHYETRPADLYTRTDAPPTPPVRSGVAWESQFADDVSDIQ